MAHEPNLLARIREARHTLEVKGPPYVRGSGDFERVTVPAHDCDVLRDMLANARPSTVIEIGLAYGSSALAIAEALVEAGLDGARHLIIDAYQKKAFHGSGWDAIVQAGLTDLCVLLEEPPEPA